MTNPMRFGVLVFCAALSASSVRAQGLPQATSPEEVGLSSERLARIGKALRGEIDAKRIPGAVAIIARKGRVAYFEAMGARDPANGSQMTKDDIFRVYSMTKPFVAVATFIAVLRPSASPSMLGWVGSRCWMTTKPIPLSGGMADKSSPKAASPPAEAPIPTIGKLARACWILLDFICACQAPRGVVRSFSTT